MEVKAMKKLLKDACLFSVANCREAFIYEYPNGKRCYSDLATVNHIMNKRHENIHILYNMYRIKNSSFIAIFNIKNGDYSYYDFKNNEFFKA